jgi:hypothetical protein
VDASFDSDIRPTSHLLEWVHNEIFGPMTTSSHGGAKYFLTFLDAISIHMSTRLSH